MKKFANIEFEIHPVYYEGKTVGQQYHKEYESGICLSVFEYHDGYDFILTIPNSISERKKEISFVNFSENDTTQEDIEKYQEQKFYEWFKEIEDFMFDKHLLLQHIRYDADF